MHPSDPLKGAALRGSGAAPHWRWVKDFGENTLWRSRFRLTSARSRRATFGSRATVTQTKLAGISAARKRSMRAALTGQIEGTSASSAQSRGERVQDFLANVAGQQTKDKVGREPTQPPGSVCVGIRSIRIDNFSHLNASSICQRSWQTSQISLAGMSAGNDVASVRNPAASVLHGSILCWLAGISSGLLTCDFGLLRRQRQDRQPGSTGV
jgi:hypothetical protein